MSAVQTPSFVKVIADISQLAWDRLSEGACVDVAWAYYFFSVQFRENLDAARRLHPTDENLLELEQGECDTDNLAPWPGVAKAGERMNHDEFMRRSLALGALPEERRRRFERMGQRYLHWTRGLDQTTQAMSIASYEDGGLEAVFTAMLRMPDYPNPVLRAFRHFLSEHIRFDSDPDAGHGALARHIRPDERIEPLWSSFRDLLVDFAPSLDTEPVVIRAAE